MPWLGEGWTSKNPPGGGGGGLPWTAPIPDVTNFTPAGETIWTGIDGFAWANHTPVKAWSLTNPDSQTVRFETRGGDQWYWDIDNATGSSHNSMQLIDQTPVGNNFTAKYEFMVEAGSPITSWFTVFDQIQTDPGGTPPFFIGIEEQKHIVRIATNQSNWIYPYRDTVDIIRGHWYQIQLTINFTAGVLDVIRDGVQIVNYRGPLGYAAGGSGAYQIGIYRNDVPETLAVNYRNLIIIPG